MATVDRLTLAKAIDLRTIITLEKQSSYRMYNNGCCPFHDDQQPSFIVYPDHFFCMSTSCGARGNIFNWYAYKIFGDVNLKLRGHDFTKVLDEILGSPTKQIDNRSKSIEEDEPIDLNILAISYHNNLQAFPRRFNYFLSRGFTAKTVNEQQWGWDGKNYTIPVWSGMASSSKVMSIRLRSAVVGKNQRYSGIRDYNQQILYNTEALLYAKSLCRKDVCLFCFYGELDAALAWQDNLIAVSPTNGALSFVSSWVDGYKGDVIFLPDKGEEQAAYMDAGAFGSRGWVLHLPYTNDTKDYGELRNAGFNCNAIHELMPKVLKSNIFKRI